MDWLDLLTFQDTQESSPTPQFKSIDSLVLSFLYSPTLTSIHDYWKTIALNRWTFVGKVMSLLICFPNSSVGKESACNAGDFSSIPELGRPTGEGIGYTLKYS